MQVIHNKEKMNENAILFRINGSFGCAFKAVTAICIKLAAAPLTKKEFARSPAKARDLRKHFDQKIQSK